MPDTKLTRTKILDAALELFRERGFEAATMRDIAKRSGVATGAAYYYFPSKDAIVLAFYRRAMDEMAPQLEEALSKSTDLRELLAGIVKVKLRCFEPSRGLLSALAAHVDPRHPLSPFGDQTRDIQEQDIQIFDRALSVSGVRIPDDLRPSLPRILWLWQMGLILFWINDGSPEQKRTALLADKSVALIVMLLRLSGLPLMRPLRRQVLELYEIAR